MASRTGDEDNHPSQVSTSTGKTSPRDQKHVLSSKKVAVVSESREDVKEVAATDKLTEHGAGYFKEIQKIT